MDNHKKKMVAADLVDCRDCGAKKGEPCGTMKIDGREQDWLHAVRMRDAVVARINDNAEHEQGKSEEASVSREAPCSLCKSDLQDDSEASERGTTTVSRANKAKK